MSDDRTDIRPPPPAIVEHWCGQPGCKKWGSFGYDRGRGRTDWFCFEHRPQEDRDVQSL